MKMMGTLIMSSTIITMLMILTIPTGLTVSTVRSFTAHIIHAVCFTTRGIMILGIPTIHGDMAIIAHGDTAAGIAHTTHLGTAHGILLGDIMEVAIMEVIMGIIIAITILTDMIMGNAGHLTAM
jgi:hypothetical protein